MALIHNVVDSDVRFLIDPVKRTISNQGSGKLTLIQRDHNSERFSFELPKIVEGHDMSLCNVIRIHYINTCSKTRSTSVDIYEPNDLCISEENPQNVHFSWLIAKSATVYAGSLAFTIEFECEVNGEVVYSWHTGINNTIAISDGINNSEAVAEDYSDILTIWWNRIYANSTLPIEMLPMEEFAALNGETKENTLYLLEDDPTLEEIRRIAEDCNYDDDIDTLNNRTVNNFKRIVALEEIDMETSKEAAVIRALLESVRDSLVPLQTEMQNLSNRVRALESSGGSGSGGGTVDPDIPDEPDEPIEPDDPDEPDEPEIPDHYHNYNVKVATVLPTCEEKGYTTYKCNCGEGGTVNREYTNPTGHSSGSSIVTPPTCTEDGYTTHICSVCNKSYINTPTPKLGHNWSYYQDSSAGETGWSRTCAICNSIEINVEYGCGDNGDDHSWVEDGVEEATCTLPKYQKYVCSVCSETKKEAVGLPTGHNYQPDVVTDNTCTLPALQKYKCANCGDTSKEPDVIRPALGHNYTTEAIIDATCTEPAWQVYKCTRCSDTYQDQYSPPLGHDWSEAIYDVVGAFPPTCTEVGCAVHTCNRCPEEKTENVPPLQHEFTTETFEPTCTERGYTHYQCKNCEYNYDANFVAAKGHSLRQVVSILPPDCTTPGYQLWDCHNCNSRIREDLPATGHNYVTEPVDPDNRNDDVSSTGYVDICTVCGNRDYANHT